MKTIKIIDLLNRCIARDKTLPTFIGYNSKVYELAGNKTSDAQGKPFYYPGLVSDLSSTDALLEEVDVLSEDKEIEDTKYMRHHEGDGKCYIESKGHKYYVPYDLLLLIDDLVKAVNELRKGK